LVAAQPTVQVRDVGVPELKAALDAGTVQILVDVRSSQEFAEGHVPGAVNIPMDQIGQRFGELDAFADNEIWVICALGGRSAKVSGQLVELGFKPVNVDGGTKGWIAAGHPVE
jgi:rhodanese-related sulfurtransferase